MVLAFSEDPLDGASSCSNGSSDVGSDFRSLGDESSIEVGSHCHGVGVLLMDETLVKVIPRDPDFLRLPPANLHGCQLDLGGNPGFP
ncbi:hypothetical protein ACA910_016574 [Epithemia clementina (nom. ined.)]